MTTPKQPTIRPGHKATNRKDTMNSKQMSENKHRKLKGLPGGVVVVQRIRPHGLDDARFTRDFRKFWKEFRLLLDKSEPVFNMRRVYQKIIRLSR
jgi:hypothetical protein